MRGVMKRGSRQTDLIAIGDLVEFEYFPDGTGVIENVLPRKNELVRLMTGIRYEYRQILISNLDQILLVFAAAQPEPKLRMLDRFLVICEKQHIPPIILVNKIDLTGLDAARALFAIYPKIGYETLFTSAVSDEGVDELKGKLKGKVTGLVGPSGVGKSSLINQMYPGLNLKVNEISEYNQKGRHTTVVREMFLLPEGGFIADLPGIKSLALWDTEPEELDGYFPEISPLVSQCLYSDCTHHPEEQGCAVQLAVENGTVSAERYQSYLQIRYGDAE
jgi:ribosome biogenesis GTPase